MDYLISEGYPSAAQKFALEANIQQTVDLEPIRERVVIRNTIYQGDIKKAIELINEANPEVSCPLSRLLCQVLPFAVVYSSNGRTSEPLL